MKTGDWFDRDYYERGLESGKSCYSNYRWIPELTVPMAMTMIDYLGIGRWKTVLDYGCAKGYLVNALRLLHRPAWGIDISPYAISKVHPDAKPYCFLKKGHVIRFPKGAVKPPERFDFCIAKDVFEHIPLNEIISVLHYIEGNVLFAVIPLGDDGSFRCSTNNLDKSHDTCLNETEWRDIFSESKWELKDFTFRINGIKDSYYDKTPNGHGFFLLSNKV